MRNKIISTIIILCLTILTLHANENAEDSAKNKKIEKYFKRTVRNLKPLKMVMKLNLTSQQKEDIKELVQKNKKIKIKIKNKQRISDAFSDTTFNKSKFTLALKQKRNKKIKKQLDMFTAIYALLTPSQKKELNTLMHKKKKKKKN